MSHRNETFAGAGGEERGAGLLRLLRTALPALGEPRRIVEHGPLFVAALRPAANRGYIVGPFYDWGFFIAAPLIALAIGLAVSGTPLDRNFGLLSSGDSWASTFIGTFIFAHLVAVIFRSHLNRSVFRRYPLRFTLVPIALFMTVGVSPWAMVACSVAATFWDVYHSSMQTFGLGRIYDMRAGNDFRVGRRLDIVFNLFLYAGPIAAGATLMDHIEDFYEFRAVGAAFFTQIPVHVQSNAHYLSLAVLGAGIPFFAYYVYAYWRYARLGYRVSMQKVALFAATGITAIWVWGFNPFGQAFFIMNFFHALQYFALVWWSERNTMIGAFRLSRLAWAKPAALALFLAGAFGYGFWAETYGGESRWLLGIILVIALMHFWYDGFIWSVSRKDVKVR